MNYYKLFQNLLPRRPLELGTVTAVDPTGCTIHLPGGGTLRVRGQATVNDRVFIRDGAIEGPAPDLGPAILIDV